MYLHNIKKDSLSDLFNAPSVQDLNLNFKNICDNYGIETFSVIVISKKIESTSGNHFSCFDNYPKQWMDHYQGKKYYSIDPVLLQSSNIATPHFWHIDKFNEITDTQKNMLSEACDFGITRGTTIPLLPNNKFNGYLTLIDTNIHHPETLYVLSNAAHIYVNKKSDLEKKQAFDLLTDKEILVLAFKADGLMTKQIADKLQVSDATVIFHLKNIRKKLGCLTTEQAVFKYIDIK
jgi:DNA-binding CsgD family transcriptional regulator